MPFLAGTSLSLAALAEEGNRFDGWSGDLTSTQTSVTVVINNNMMVNASFSLIPPPTYRITFIVTDSKGIPITDATVSLDGTSYTAGQYQFFGQEAGEYSYQIARTGYFTNIGQITIIDNDITVTIALQTDDTQVADMETTTVKVFPNPARETLHISASAALLDIQLFNGMGQAVYAANGGEETTHHVNVNDLPAGIYFLQVQTNQGSHIKKVLVSGR